MRAIGSTLYVTGGIVAGSEFEPFVDLNDLWRFDINAHAWEELIPKTGPYQPPRHIPMGDWVQDALGSKRLMVYGGETVDPPVVFGFANNTWEYDIDENKWDLITDDAPIPPRDDMVCVTSAKDLKTATIFGGDTPGNIGCPLNENPTNEVWDYRVNRGEWSERRIVESTRPIPLKRHACIGLDPKGKNEPNALFIVGGWSVRCANGTFLAQPFNMDIFRLEFL